MNDRPIKLVLDATAIVAYASGRTDVGEVIAEVLDESGRFAVPAVCLYDAAIRLTQKELTVVEVMLRNTACVEVEWPASRRRMLATTRRLGSAQRAAAVLWAVAEGAYLLSGEPDAYGNPGFAIEV